MVVALMLAAASGWAGPATGGGHRLLRSGRGHQPPLAQADQPLPDPDRRRPRPPDRWHLRRRGPARAATPVASPEAIDAAVDIDLVIRALAACLTAGDYETVTELGLGQFLGVLAGTRR